MGIYKAPLATELEATANLLNKKFWAVVDDVNNEKLDHKALSTDEFLELISKIKHMAYAEGLLSARVEEMTSVERLLRSIEKENF